MKFYAGKNLPAFCIDLCIKLDDETFVVDMTSHTTKVAPETVAPVNHLTFGEAQNLMDALYDAGVRPTEARNITTDPIKYHLEDMKKIAFKFLEQAK